MSCKIRFAIVLLAVGAVQFSPALKQLISRRSSFDVRLLSESNHLSIYDGKKTTIAKHPYLCAVLLFDYFSCACTILSKSYVITSADCAYGFSPSYITIVTGSSNGTNGTRYQAQEITVPKNYGKLPFDGNYALIKVKDKIKFDKKTKAVKLPKKCPAPNTKVKVSGYGRTEPSGGYRNEELGDWNRTLMVGMMTWLDKKECASFYSGFSFNWTEQMGCAYNKNKTTLCYGDWADPAVKNGELIGFFLAGASKGFCSSAAYPGIFGNVFAVKDWIISIIGNEYDE